MDFTVNVMESRGMPVSQATVSAMGGAVAYQTHHQQTGPTHQNQSLSLGQHPVGNHHHQLTNHQHQVREVGMHSDATGKVEVAIVKEDCSHTFTPPPRSASVGVITHHENRVEKGTDTMDFEPAIKVEIRGVFPGFSPPVEKDKGNVVQLHFNSVSEVLHYFSQKTSPNLDAFNLLANPDLVRNINPEIVRNHFLYVPSAQEPPRATTNTFAVGANSQAPSMQTNSSPIIMSTGGSPVKQTIKQERRRGELPPGTIIHRHVQLEVLPNQFVCWICSIDLQKSVPFEEHMSDQHSVEKPYKCDGCGVTFKRKAHLDRHRRIHLSQRPYQCGVCGKGFTRNEHVRRHAFTHSGEKPFTCATCTKTFSRREHLIKHQMSHAKASGPHSPSVTHPATPGEYEYAYSPAESPLQTLQASIPHEMAAQMQLHPGLLQLNQYSNQGSLNNVSINVNKQQGNLQQSGLGSGLLMQATDQSGRILTIGSAPSVVSGNGASTSNSVAGNGNVYHIGSAATSSQGSRQQNTGEPASRPYQCGVCGKAFIRNEHLRRHVLTHSGEKPHVCATCTKAFSRKEHLTKHIRSHNKALSTVTHQVAVAPQPTIQLTAAGNASNLANSQVSLGNHVAVSNGILGGPTPVSSTSTVVAAAHTAAVSAAHTIANSHPSVSHAAHLPPGTYLPMPMFSLLAEVV